MSKLSSTQELMIQMRARMQQGRCKPSQQALAHAGSQEQLEHRIELITGKNMAIKKRHKILRKREELLQAQVSYKNCNNTKEAKTTLLLSNKKQISISEKEWVEDFFQFMTIKLNKELEQLNAIILS